MSQETKEIRVTILVSPTELKAIDDWSFDRRIRSRSEAIRQLVKSGIEGEKAKRIQSSPHGAENQEQHKP
ncbi:ribbon-helix-helix domain-containing protein [Shinella zoogloeoides]|uniref:ribbon-helix-helix domain-containing protein n=1 Tax=Shinella zoogloeoides TaxID=352475 RepID=UPI001F578563|nr:ribbon-helix-helix domain-containing protein [Shinella zoogloeoides]